MEDRSLVSQLFHQWARKSAFQIPRRLVDKVVSSFIFVYSTFFENSSFSASISLVIFFLIFLDGLCWIL